MKTAHPVEASGFLHHKSGYDVPVLIRAVPVHNSHGSIIGAVETFDELEQTDLNRAEKAIPGSVDEITGLASPAQMKSHLREALANFTEHQVAFSMLRFACRVWSTSAPPSTHPEGKNRTSSRCSPEEIIFLPVLIVALPR